MGATLELFSQIEGHADASLLHSLVPAVPELTWRKLLTDAGGLRTLLLQDDIRLQTLLPASAVASLRAAAEMMKRFELSADERPTLSSPASFYRHLRPHLAHLPVERFLVLSVNSRSVLLGTDVVGEGSVDQCHVDPRHVFRAVLARGAAGFVIAHNHPSGSPEPSSLDIALTRQLAQSAELLCIRLLDHLIIGSNGYESLLARGFFQTRRSA